MPLDFDLFISYSSKDKPIADALLTGLETDGIRCWIAPRNVQPGKTWAGSIVRGIRDAEVFVLVLTDQSNQSNQVLNEVERAISLQKPVVCYRAERIVLSDDLELFLSSKHWIEAHDRPVNETISMLVKAVRPLLPPRQEVMQPPVVVAEIETTPDERDQFLRNGKKAYLAQDFALAIEYFTEAADADSGEALFYLGEMHRKGEGIKRAPAKAKQYYKNAIEKGSALGYWGLARMLDEADELPDRARQYYEQAREAIAEMAVEEDAYCCYLYSLMYDGGKGINKDEKRAERWFEKAIENGYKPPVNVKPLTVPTEPPVKTRPVNEPIKPEPQTSEQPPTLPIPTQPEPAETKRVETTASALLFQATDSDEVDNRKQIYFETSNPYTSTSTEKKRFTRKFFVRLILILAILSLVIYYSIQSYEERKARSTWVDDEDDEDDSTTTMSSDTTMMSADSAISYVDKSPDELLQLAEKGDADAQDWLGSKYYYGEGVEKDYQKALYWYQKSAGQGNVSAQSTLGFMYQNGIGVTQDYQMALDWYRKSADQGNSNAQNGLGVMYYDGTGVVKDDKVAVEWFLKASRQGNSFGQYDLAARYENGEGVTKDLVEAKRLYGLAAAQGQKDAIKALKRLSSN